MKKISAGVIITDGKKILLGHATGKSHKYGYDIFKGGIGSKESKIQGALRELKEESGIVLNPTDLQDLGVFPYTSNKDLYLFKYVSNDIKTEFPLSSLKCTSYMPNLFYKHINKLIITEMDGFIHCPLSDLNKYLYRSLQPIINKIIFNKTNLKKVKYVNRLNK